MTYKINLFLFTIQDYFQSLGAWSPFHDKILSVIETHGNYSEMSAQFNRMISVQISQITNY